MRKYKFIALAMVLAVMLMGAGYAYWTETLTVQGTVSTGDLDLRFDPVLIESGDYDDEFPYFLRDYMNVSVKPGDDYKSLECKFENIYPGAGGFIRFKIVNVGTVPAQLTELKGVIKSDNANLKDEFDYTIERLRLYVPKDKIVFPLPWPLPDIEIPYEYTDIIWEGNEIRVGTFSEFFSVLEEKLSEYELQPFAYFEINGEGSGYNIELPGTVTNDAFEDQEFVFDINMKFTQGE